MKEEPVDYIGDLPGLSEAATLGISAAISTTAGTVGYCHCSGSQLPYSDAAIHWYSHTVILPCSGILIQ